MLNSTYLGKETLVFIALPWLRHDVWYFYSRYTKAYDKTALLRTSKQNQVINVECFN